MRNPGLGLGLALLVLGASMPAVAATAEEYERVFNHYKPVPISSLTHFREHRGDYLGEVFELRAIVQGNLSGKIGNLLLLRLDDGQTLQVPVGNLTSLMATGCAVRMIVRSLQQGGDFQLLAVAAQKDADAVIPAPSRPVVGTISGSGQGPYPSRGASAGTIASALVGPYNDQQIIAAYARAVRSFNRRLSDSEASALASMIIQFSRKWGVDARLVMAVVAAESRFNPLATSRKGAMGLGQLMPATARGMGVQNAYDPSQNLDACVCLIRNHLEQGAGDLDTTLSLALARYNAGGGAVRRWGGVPPYRETLGYIARVKDVFLQMAPEYAPYVR
jgi:soluble lytic murein transglycosylase-like protein